MKRVRKKLCISLDAVKQFKSKAGKPRTLYSLVGSWPEETDSTVHTQTEPAHHTNDLLLPDVLYCIMQKLSATDVLRCRQVCVAWCKVASSDALWRSRFNVPEPLIVSQWATLPLHVQFVRYTFTGASYEQLVQFIVAHPHYLPHIFQCKMLSTASSYRLIPDTFRVATWAKHRRYWIPQNQNVIKTDHKHKDLQWWINSYRKRIEKK